MGVQKTDHGAVNGQFKGHRYGVGIHGREAEQQRAEQGQYKTDAKPILPAADQATQQYGNMHGQKHFADSGDLPGEEGEYQTDGQEHGGQNKIFQGCMFHHIFPLFS